MSPRVSIIVRTKDRAKFLTRAIADITAQTFNNYEVFIVNDGGDPKAVDEVLSSWGTDSRFEVIHLPQNRGMEAASNLGLEKARGEFISIHDDDDTWEPTFLEKTTEALSKHQDWGAVAVRTEIIYETIKDGEIVFEGRQIAWPEIRDINLISLSRQNQAVPISCLYRKSTLDELGGFRADLPVVGDWEYHLRLARYSQIGFLDGAPLAYWHQRPSLQGTTGNSVFAAQSEHTKYDSKIRREYLGNDLSNEQIGRLLANGVEFHFLREQNYQLDHKLNDANDQLRSLNDQIRPLAEQVRALTDLVVAQNERIGALEQQVAQQTQTVSEIKEMLNWLLHKVDHSSVIALGRNALKQLKPKK
ncbi:hypothetical protein BK816_03380 [Boudabousia tangfeifanii]|uniref:Glycosyltransferase 2-like domain-containing protein n=1 Tax=Boudabousia tangfeifanii TaxID=1912795 RepID=A0A1D9MJI9_9ACTO|nr:glycosyltransferase family 2 protein [Boudabousia tangfeifanii]AOZ72452.1 hypothetical protein BK816_03380 [Boudabousia tangfeifanii]